MGALLGPKLCPQESSVRASPSIQALGGVAGGAHLRTLGTASRRVCQLLTWVPWALRSPEHLHSTLVGHGGRWAGGDSSVLGGQPQESSYPCPS